MQGERQTTGDQTESIEWKDKKANCDLKVRGELATAIISQRDRTECSEGGGGGVKQVKE